MDPTTSGIAEPMSGIARWFAISIGVAVLLALPAAFVMAIPEGGELAALNVVPAVGLLIFEIVMWWRLVVFSAESQRPAPSILFCLGAIVSQLPLVAISATDLVVNSYLDIVLVLVIKVVVAAGTWSLQALRRR